MEHESDGDTNWNWGTWNSPQRIDTVTGGLGNKRTSGDPPNYSIVKIGLNTEKSPGDFWRLTVAQNLMRNYQLTMMWKTHSYNEKSSKELLFSGTLLSKLIEK